MKRAKFKLNGARGATLAETLLAVAILLLVTSVVAAGIPAAVNAYDKVVSASNAQLLLSTTMIRLRDEIGAARELECDGADIVFIGEDGSRSRIFQDGGIMIREYADVVPGDLYTHPLVSDQAASGDMYASFTLGGYENGVLTIKDLSVIKDGNTLAKEDIFKIKVLAYQD